MSLGFDLGISLASGGASASGGGTPAGIDITAPSDSGTIAANALQSVTFTFTGSVTAVDVRWQGVSLGAATLGSGSGSFAWTPTPSQAAAGGELRLVATVSGGSPVEDAITLTVTWNLTDAQVVRRIDSYAADATWSRPTHLRGLTGTYRRARVDLWAPGGGGNPAGNAGGGGAYSRGDNVDLSGSSSWAIAGLAGGASNTDGTDATFGGTVVVAAAGKSGGNGGTGGDAKSCVGDQAYSGGNGVAGKGVQGGGSAGSAGNASGAVGGTPDGSTGTTSLVGRHPGGGGGVSGGGIGQVGGSGRCQVTYEVEATAGFSRFRAHARSRTDTSTTLACTLPLLNGESTVVAGDLLIALIGGDSNTTLTASAGWTSLGTDANSTLVRASVFYRVATGNASDALTITSGASSRISAALLRFSGAGTPEATLTNGDSTNPDPPSHTFSGGSNKATWIAFAVSDQNTSASMTAPPTNYGSWIVISSANNTGSVYLSFALRELETATENPGAFTAATEQWVAATACVPAAA